MQPLEAALGAISIFSALRPDEIGRIALRFSPINLRAGERAVFEGTEATARAIVVVTGCIDVELDDPLGKLTQRLRACDRVGDTAILTGSYRTLRVCAQQDSQLAELDRAGLEGILEEFPAVALPLANELARELRARNDQVRRAFEIRTRGLSTRQTISALRDLGQSLRLRSVAVRRLSVQGLFRRLIVERGDEPHFWMLVGFLLGLLGARIVVHLILKYKLEKQLFALVAGSDPNPVHIHHYNYGLLVVGLVGLVALSPRARSPLRALALAFGLGCGLVFDEFALFWNLNPDYTQGLSLISSAIAGIVLLQLVYFRRFWKALLERAWSRMGGE